MIEYLTIEMMCMKLNVSRMTFWKMRRAGALPEPVELRKGVLRWIETEVDEWFQSRRSAA